MKADLGQYGYAGQVGQNPVPPTGGMFQVHNFQVIDLEPHAVNVLQTVRYWDKAGTTGAGAYTVGCKMARLASGKFVVLDVRRGQWATEMREAVIQQMAESDGQNCVIYHEQEPGPIWEEELVQMADGSQKKLKDITKNDRIIDGKGKIAKVKKVFIQGKLPCLCITTFSGRTIHAALNHPFLTPTGYVNVNELLVGEMLALRTKREIEPISKPTLEECRLAGYFIGDGCCTYQHPNNPRDRSINAKITCSDPIEGQDILHCVESIGARGRIGPSGIHYAFGGGICDWLRKRELAGKGTLDKKVPEWIATADDKCVANFIGAYFACDGYAMFGKGGKTIEFYSTTHPLISRVQSLLLRFGIYSRLRAKKLPLEFQKTRHICYYLKLTKGRHDDSCAKFAHRIPVHGKKDRYLKKMFRHDFDAPYLADEIMSITRVEKELPCRCLEIEGDPSFLVNDIVVHNSGGKESAQATVRNLAGFANYADRPTGDKVFRADPYSVQVNNGNVMLLRGEWNQAFIEEHRFFPYGTHKDQVDAAAGACAKLAAKKMVRRIV
jgi:phage terminase large subunit-like protein